MKTTPCLYKAIITFWERNLAHTCVHNHTHRATRANDRAGHAVLRHAGGGARLGHAACLPGGLQAIRLVFLGCCSDIPFPCPSDRLPPENPLPGRPYFLQEVLLKTSLFFLGLGTACDFLR